MVCPGGQGDVSVYKNLMFMSVEMPNGRLDCGVQGFPPEPPPPAADEKDKDKEKDKKRSEEHTSELQSRLHLVCRLLLEKKKTTLRQRLVYQDCIHKMASVDETQIAVVEAHHPSRPRLCISSHHLRTPTQLADQ